MQKEGGEVDKQSAWGRENAVKTIIVFPNVQALHFDKFLDAFFPEPPLE